MDQIPELLSRAVEQLLGRAGGPLHFRLIMMPTVVTVLAIRAGLRDARDGRPAFMWGFLTNPFERARLFKSAVADIGRIFLVALVLDTIYQLIVFRTIYPGQLLIVAVVCAIVPYVLIRGPVTRIVRALSRSRPGPAAEVAAGSGVRPDDHESR